MLNVHNWKYKRVIVHNFGRLRESIGVTRPYPKKPVKYAANMDQYPGMTIGQYNKKPVKYAANMDQYPGMTIGQYNKKPVKYAANMANNQA